MWKLKDNCGGEVYVWSFKLYILCPLGGMVVRHSTLTSGKIIHTNNPRFWLLLNLIGQNLQGLQYIVFHWNKCNTAPEVKRWLTDSPTMMCVSWSRPGQHNWDETLVAVSASSTMYNSLQNKQTRIHSVETEMKPCSFRISKLLQYHKFNNLGFV